MRCRSWFGVAPSSSRCSSLGRARGQHAVADEAVADADDHRHLADLLGERDSVARTSGAVAVPRTISKSFITLAGEKKCRPTTSCGRPVRLRSGRRRDRRCWRRGSRRAWLSRRACRRPSCLTAMSSNTASMTMSQSARLGIVGGAGKQRQRCAFAIVGQRAARDGDGVVLLDRREPAVQRLAAHFQQRDRNAAIGEATWRCRRPWCRRR